MIFGHEEPENGPEGTALENSLNFLEKMFLKNEIKSDDLSIRG